MKVLFLDFDGVINHHRSTRRGPIGLLVELEAIQRLNRFIAITGCVVVIISSWRTGREDSVPTLVAELEYHGFVGDVVGETPDALNDPTWERRRRMRHHDSFSRGDEILDWIDRHPEVTAFVVLDDVDDIGALRSCWVRVDARTALTDENLDEAIDVLERSPRVIQMIRNGLR